MYPVTPRTRQKALRIFSELDTERLLEIVSRTPKSLMPAYALSELQSQVEKDLQEQKEMFDPDSQEAKDDYNKQFREGFNPTRAVRSRETMPRLTITQQIGSSPGPRERQTEPGLKLGASVPGGVDMKPVLNRSEPSRKIVSQALDNQYSDEMMNDNGGGGSGLPF